MKRKFAILAFLHNNDRLIPMLQKESFEMLDQLWSEIQAIRTQVRNQYSEEEIGIILLIKTARQGAKERERGVIKLN